MTWTVRGKSVVGLSFGFGCKGGDPPDKTSLTTSVLSVAVIKLYAKLGSYFIKAKLARAFLKVTIPTCTRKQNFAAMLSKTDADLLRSSGSKPYAKKQSECMRYRSYEVHSSGLRRAGSYSYI